MQSQTFILSSRIKAMTLLHNNNNCFNSILYYIQLLGAILYGEWIVQVLTTNSYNIYEGRTPLGVTSQFATEFITSNAWNHYWSVKAKLHCSQRENTLVINVLLDTDWTTGPEISRFFTALTYYRLHRFYASKHLQENVTF